MNRNIFATDCVAEEVDVVAKSFVYDNQPFEIHSHISNWKRTGRFSELRRYSVYFWVGFRYFLSRKRIRNLVGWQQFYALIFCFFSSIFYVKKTTYVVALNYTYKEKTGKKGIIYRWFMQRCMNPKYLDLLHVPSAQYADTIAEMFCFPRERILVSGFGVNDEYQNYRNLPVPDGYEQDGYALAIGRSNRDYDFLIRAWKTIHYPLVIISDIYTGKSTDEHIVILNNVVGEQSHPWIAHCGLMIIPIDDGAICSGDTVLLTSMSVKRKIIATIPSTLAEMYLIDQRNALLTPKDISTFQEVAIQALTDERYTHMGEIARKDFLEKYSRKSMGINLNQMIMQKSRDSKMGQ